MVEATADAAAAENASLEMYVSKDARGFNVAFTTSSRKEAARVVTADWVPAGCRTRMSMVGVTVAEINFSLYRSITFRSL